MSSKVDKFPFLHTVHPNTNVSVSRAFIDSINSEIPFNVDVLLKRSGCRQGDNSQEDACVSSQSGGCLVSKWVTDISGRTSFNEFISRFCHKLIVINRIYIAHQIFHLATLLCFCCSLDIVVVWMLMWTAICLILDVTRSLFNSCRCKLAVAQSSSHPTALKFKFSVIHWA